MSQQDGEKKEKFEFDATGEAVGYISLDQARIVAIQHARDNTDFYGRPYSELDLVWEIVSQEESEDYYNVRLSFRPSTGFRGEPGLEQFTIDKTGEIELRQLLQRPVERRTRLPRVATGLLVAALVGIAVFFGVRAIGSDAEVTGLAVSPDGPAQLWSVQGGDVVTQARISGTGPAAARGLRRL